MEAEARRVQARAGAEEPIAAGVCGTQAKRRAEGPEVEVSAVESRVAQAVAEDWAADPVRVPAEVAAAQEADLVAVREWVTEVAGRAGA